MSIGLVLNLVVVAANWGMPVDLSRVGLSQAQEAETAVALDDDSLHERLDDLTRLPLLADVYPLAFEDNVLGVFSVGDFVLALGAGVAAFEVTRSQR